MANQTGCVNNAGWTVGANGVVGQFAGRGVLHTDSGGLVNLSTLGGLTSTARDVNNSGRIVGNSRIPNGDLRAFLWKDGLMGALPPFPNEATSTVRGISDAGHIIGDDFTAYLYDGRDWQPLTTLFGKSITQDANDYGVIVGSSALGDGSSSTVANTRAAAWLDGDVFNLGILAPPGEMFLTSVAESINNRGEYVGWSNVSGGGRTAMFGRVDQPGEPVDLADLVPANVSLRFAYAINDAGQIAAQGLGSRRHPARPALDPARSALDRFQPGHLESGDNQRLRGAERSAWLPGDVAPGQAAHRQHPPGPWADRPGRSPSPG